MREMGWPAAMPSIDRDSIVPIYQQIYEELREAILTGTLPELTRLPPERTPKGRGRRQATAHGTWRRPA